MTSRIPHSPITFQLYLQKPPAVKKILHFRKLNGIDIEEFRSDIIASQLTRSPRDDIDGLVAQYNDTMSNILDKHAPLITKEVRVRPNTPWYDESVTLAKRERRKPNVDTSQAS